MTSPMWMIGVFLLLAKLAWAARPIEDKDSGIDISMEEMDEDVTPSLEFKLANLLTGLEAPVQLKNKTVVSLEVPRSNMRILSPETGMAVLKVTYLLKMGTGTVTDLLGETTYFTKGDPAMYFYYDGKRTMQVSTQRIGILRKLHLVIQLIESPIVKGTGNPGLFITPEPKKKSTYRVCETRSPSKAVATIAWSRGNDTVTLDRPLYSCQLDVFRETAAIADSFVLGSKPMEVHFNSKYNFELVQNWNNLVVNLRDKAVYRDFNTFNVEIYYRDRGFTAPLPKGYPYLVTRKPSSNEVTHCVFGINPNEDGKTFNLIVSRNSKVVKGAVSYIDDKEPHQPNVIYYAEMLDNHVRISVSPQKPPPPKPPRKSTFRAIRQ